MVRVADTDGGDFQVGAIWEDAWEMVPGTKRIYLLMTVVVLLSFAAVGLVVGTLLNSISLPSAPFNSEILGQRFISPTVVIFQVLTAPLLAWYAFVGLQVTSRETPVPGQWFHALDRWPRLIALQALVVLADVVLVVLLGFVGGFFATLVYAGVAFASFFIIDQNSSVSEAVAGSFAIVRKNLGQFILFLLVVWLLGAVGGLTLGIGYLWFIPFFSISYALIYRSATGTPS